MRISTSASRTRNGDVGGADELPARHAFVQGLQERPAASEIRGIRWHPVDETIARVAGEFGRRLRRSHQGISVGDLVVAATADVFDLPLATSNTKHFPMFRGLKAPY